jgi:hypothetical protein
MHVHKLAAAVVLLCSAVSPCVAGEVYGKIVEGESPVGDASVAVQCGDTDYPAVRTDASGSYHVVVKASGKCTLTVTREGQSASLGIASYEDPVQYDLVLETKDGKLSVRRK